MKILFIIPYIPYPLDSGGNQAFYNMVDYIRHKIDVSILLHQQYEAQKEQIEALKKQWDNVTFFVFTNPSPIIEEKPEVRHPFYYKWLEKTRNSLERKMKRQMQVITKKEDVSEDYIRTKSTLPISIFTKFETGYINYVSDIAHKGFDIIQVEFYELITLGHILPQSAETIFVHHELRYIRNKNEMALFSDVTTEDYLLYRISQNLEKDALLSYKHIITLTEVDRKILTEFIDRDDHIYTSPAVIQTAINATTKFIPSTQNRLTFVGSEGHYPNLDAVVWFCKEIAPLLRKVNFKFTFQLIGSWQANTKDLQAMCPEMELTGYVEDLASFLKGSIALVPIRIGSGMRMKILESVFADIPFITTTKGVEGIDLRDKEECLIANTNLEFTNAIIQLSEDQILQEKLSRQAKLRLKEVYDPQKMLINRYSIYEQIMKNKDPEQ